jgi:pantoate--beta-alanine ligase
MIQLFTIEETRSWLDHVRSNGKTIGFVPTMGALHEGHLNLVRRAKQENDICVSSVFVNPTQFNNREDLEKYPRNLANDAGMLKQNGCDLLFAPEVEEMYPDGGKEMLEIDFGPLGTVMEGKFRPGHFKGVATIVHKLFGITQPDQAYFGKKDYQQLAIIREMVRQMNLPVKIVPCDTVREADGLAMSSRNQRLNPRERALAPLIFQVLKSIREHQHETSMDELILKGIETLEAHPEFRVEYLETGHKDSLQPVDYLSLSTDGVIFIAAHLGNVRLIDNLELFS